MKKATIILLFFSLFMLVSCDETDNQPLKLQGLVFGTTYNIIYYDSDIDYSREINQLFTEINQSISTYIDTGYESNDNFELATANQVTLESTKLSGGLSFSLPHIFLE